MTDVNDHRYGDDGLAQTVALITGASSGIGAATALALAQRGAAVSLVARRRDRLEALADRIRGDGGTALVVAADITNQLAANDAIERAAAELGRLDILVNNAGLMLLGPVVGAPVEEWQRMINVNVLGLLYCSHAGMPHLLRAADEGPRGVADLVNISSVAGRETRSGSGVYNATKHAVGAFSDALRKEVTTRHVRVSVVEPGAVDTELPSHNRPEILEEMNKRFAGTERLQADDIAETVAFIVTRPRRVAINEVLVRPTEQVARPSRQPMTPCGGPRLGASSLMVPTRTRVSPMSAALLLGGTTETWRHPRSAASGAAP